MTARAWRVSWRKTNGGLAGEHPGHLARAEEFEAKALASRPKANEAAARAIRLGEAAAALQGLTGVEMGEIRTLPGPRTPLQRLLDRGELRKAGESALRVLRDEGLLTEELRDAVGAVLEGLDREEEIRRHEERRRDVIRAQAEEAEAARLSGRRLALGRVEGRAGAP